mgnify:CR=1 FL=1
MTIGRYRVEMQLHPRTWGMVFRGFRQPLTLWVRVGCVTVTIQEGM